MNWVLRVRTTDFTFQLTGTKTLDGWKFPWIVFEQDVQIETIQVFTEDNKKLISASDEVDFPVLFESMESGCLKIDRTIFSEN